MYIVDELELDNERYKHTDFTPDLVQTLLDVEKETNP